MIAVSIQAQRNGAAPGQDYVISGRVVDPRQLKPEGAVLMLGQPDGDTGFTSIPVPLDFKGTFTTPRRARGTYILEFVRTPHSSVKPATVVGFSVVTIDTADVTGVTVEVRPDFALTGRFRMESDNPKAEWPTHVHVIASLALDGLPELNSRIADGAPGGRFVLRNAFGPRVLRCGYALAPGSKWWPSRVTLDGVDVTNVPTDFSAHPDGQLDVVFTQRPARIAGTVVDARGQPVFAPWIVAVSANGRLWQKWATTSQVSQGNTTGRFSFPVLPGAYLVAAVSQRTFDSWHPARDQVLRYARAGVPVEVKDGQPTTVTLTVQGSR